MDGRQVGEVRGVRECHGNVEGGHGDGCDKIALEVAPLVLLRPVEDGDIVLEVHHALMLDTMALGEPPRCAHLLPILLVQDAVGKGVAQQRVRLVWLAILWRLLYAREGATKALFRVYAARKAAVVAMRRRPRITPVEAFQVLLVQQPGARRGLEIDLDDAARGIDVLVG